MEGEADEIKRLFYLIAPIVFVFVTFSAIVCYELGKHGFANIDWWWILKIELPVIIISIPLLLKARKQPIE